MEALPLGQDYELQWWGEYKSSKEGKEGIAAIVSLPIVHQEEVVGEGVELESQYEFLKNRGCDAAVLGCTEIPLLVDPRESPLPTLDSTRVLARAAPRTPISGAPSRPKISIQFRTTLARFMPMPMPMPG